MSRTIIASLLAAAFALPNARAEDTEPAPVEAPAFDVMARAMQPRTGDFDDMSERRLIRVLVAFGRSSYFVDRGRQYGVTYELFNEFENHVNERQKNKVMRIQVVFIPVRRDQLIPSLVEGRGDIAAANLTITQGRLEQVDFADPVLENVREVVVTGPESPAVKSLQDLSGKEVVVRRSSSYYASLEKLNATLTKEGKPPVVLTAADENLEDEDLLEMLSAGMIPLTVVDNHVGELWSKVFKGITVHNDLAVRTGGKIAWAVRKNNPQLKRVLNGFIPKAKKGTTLGNILFRRYLQDTRHARNALSPGDAERFTATMGLFKRYAAQYEFDWLLVVAQAYQESRLDQSLRSPAGAVGIMQVLPRTAAGAPINIKQVERLENNIHAGVKYLRHVVDQYFDEPGIDPFNRQLFAFAAYNAGPSRVAGLRKMAVVMGYNPNVWFQNVEIVAAGQIGRETVQYVGNILKYYVAYGRLVAQKEARERAKAELKEGG